MSISSLHTRSHSLSFSLSLSLSLIFFLSLSLTPTQSSRDHLRSEKRRYDERIRSEVDKSQKSLRRALEAEVEVLNMRRDVVARPCEQRLKEVEAMW